MQFNRIVSAKRITNLLIDNGIKQKELAQSLGIKSANIVSYWCSLKDNYRQPTVEQFAALADFFGVSVDYLMGLSDYPQRRPSLADELGLSHEAIMRLTMAASDPSQKIIINTLLESEELFSLTRKILLAQELKGRVNVGKLF